MKEQQIKLTRERNLRKKARQAAYIDYWIYKSEHGKIKQLEEDIKD
jgi:hypothetical protein